MRRTLCVLFNTVCSEKKSKTTSVRRINSASNVSGRPSLRCSDSCPFFFAAALWHQSGCEIDRNPLELWQRTLTALRFDQHFVKKIASNFITAIVAELIYNRRSRQSIFSLFFRWHRLSFAPFRCAHIHIARSESKWFRFISFSFQMSSIQQIKE